MDECVEAKSSSSVTDNKVRRQKLNPQFIIIQIFTIFYSITE